MDENFLTIAEAIADVGHVDALTALRQLLLAIESQDTDDEHTREAQAALWRLSRGPVDPPD